MKRVAIIAAVVAGLTAVGLPAASASEQGCTGETASTVAQAVVPFGAAIVAPTAQAVDNFGLQVIEPEATAPHDACP